MSKFLTFILTSSLFFFTTTTCLAFTDLPTSHWSYDYINALSKQGIINGYSDETFRPDQAITRAELLKIALETSNKDAFAFENLYFDDFTMNDWFAEYVVFAAQNEYVSGYDDGTFRPNQNITRAEALKIILSVAGKENSSDSFVALARYKDVSENDWFAPHFSYAIQQNIISGYEDSTIRPNQSITRAEAAKIIMEVKNL